MSEQTQHIDWIDGAKGIAVISVILVHCLPCMREIGAIFHIDQCVPVFIFITAYLTSLRFESIKAYFTSERFIKMLKKILLPFIVVLAIQLVCFALAGSLPSIKSIIKGGGIGPGSYYVWVYLQIWALLPFMVWFVRKVPIWLSLVVTLAISILAEYAFVSIKDVDNIQSLYRLLSVRYIMVLYLGCIWQMLREKQKYVFFGLACISAVLILRDVYLPDVQILANTPPVKIIPPFWCGFHWYTAFYVVLPIALLERVRYFDIWKYAGKYSWYIFLLQMMCFSFK